MINKSILKLVTFKKPVKEWSPGYFLIVNTAQQLMDDLTSRELPDVESLQQASFKVQPPPSKAIVIKETFDSDQTVIDFLKAKNFEEWPGNASDINSTPAEWISHPTASQSEKILLHLHGGAYIFGCTQAYNHSNFKLSKFSGAKVLGVNYRLAPQNPFPCGLIDSVSAYTHLLKTYKSENIIIFGDSAGGGLTLATLLVIRDMNLPMCAASYLQSPWVDLTHQFPSFKSIDSLDYLPNADIKDQRLFDRRQYYSCDDLLKNGYVSPYWSESLKGLPRLFVQCGTHERLYDEVVGFSKKFELEGGDIQLEIYESHVHVFQMFRVFSASKKALLRAGVFFKDVFERKIVGIKDAGYINYNFNGDYLAVGALCELTNGELEP
jgi:acetyl esterase/lipase